MYSCRSWMVFTCMVIGMLFSMSSGKPAEKRISMETVSGVLDTLISMKEDVDARAFDSKAIRKCKAGECNHGKCLAAEGYCKCDKGWWGGYCDTVNACNEKACGSKTCFGDCPEGTAHCSATTKNAKGRFCYGPAFEFMEKYRGVTRSMVSLALRLSEAIDSP